MRQSITGSAWERNVKAINHTATATHGRVNVGGLQITVVVIVQELAVNPSNN